MPRLTSLVSQKLSGISTNPVIPVSPQPLFYLKRSRTVVGEGQTFRIDLVSANVSNASNVAYTISGVATEDINNQSLTGNFTVFNSRSFIDIITSEDELTEGIETAVITLDDSGLNVSVDITDPSFILESNLADVPEGDSFTITLTALGSPDGTEVPYTITGVASSNINGASLTGNFVVSNSLATLTIVTVEDPNAAETEVFTISLDNGFDDVSVNIRKPSFSLSRTASSIDEGETVTITLTTTYLPNGRMIPYTVTGVSLSDISLQSLNANFVIFDNSSSIVITSIEDSLTEGNETLTLSLDNGKASTTVTIVDTSKTPAYTLSSDAESVDEGGTITITLDTENVNSGTSIPYTVTGITGIDLDGDSLIGNFVVSGTYASSTATATFTLAEDATTEGNETFVLTLDNQAASVSVTINDTSKTPIYSLSRSASSINESNSEFSISLITQYVEPGTTIPYSITGVSTADITPAALAGNFTITGTYANGGSTKNFTVVADALTEGEETFTLTCNTLPDTPSISVTINDTSKTPIYSLTRSVSAANEGNTFNVILTTQNVNVGTSIAYSISGVTSADINGRSLTGFFTVSGSYDNGSSSIGITVTRDYLTEGAETFTLTCPGLPGAPSVSVVLNDTSVFGSVIYSIGDAITNAPTEFGVALATNDTYFVIGSPRYDGNKGRAYIYRHSDGALIRAVRNENVTGSINYFGKAVALNNSYAFVGAPGDSVGSGSGTNGRVWMYYINNGNTYSSFYSNFYAGPGYEEFGRALAANNTYTLASAPRESSFNAATGTYLSEGGWVGLYNSVGQYLNAAQNPNGYSTSANDRFGWSVAISPGGKWVAAATYEDKASYSDAGRLYAGTISNNSLSLSWSIASPADQTSQAFGDRQGVASNDTYFAVGARLIGVSGNYRGRVYVYKHSDGTLAYTLNSPVNEGMLFGTSVSMNSKYLAVGAPYATGAVTSGRVYIYDLSNGSLIYTIDNPDGNSDLTGGFGACVALSETRLVVSRLGALGGSSWEGGKVYVLGIS